MTEKPVIRKTSRWKVYTRHQKNHGVCPCPFCREIEEWKLRQMNNHSLSEQQRVHKLAKAEFDSAM